MDARLGILIETNFDSADAAWDKHTHKWTSSLGGISKSHQEVVRRMMGDETTFKESSLRNIKTVEEYRQDWAGKSSKKLIAFEHELTNEKVNLQNKLAQYQQEGNQIAIRIHKERLAEIAAESRALKQVSIEREEVQRSGAGALIGQLGVGRVLSGVSGGAIGALGAVGGAAGVGMLGKEFADAGMKAIGILQQERLAFESAGVSAGRMNAEMERAERLADDLSIRWNVQGDRVRQLVGYVAQLGNVTGTENTRIVKLAVGIEELTKNFQGGSITAEQFAKILARDPEAETYVGRLTLAFPALAQKMKDAANNAEELRIAEEYLTPKMKELDERAQSQEQALQRASIAWDETKRQMGLYLIQAGGLGLSTLSALSGGILGGTKVIAVLTLATGASLTALTALILVKKLEHSQTLIDTAASVKETLARWGHIAAINAETGAITVEGGAALEATPMLTAFGAAIGYWLIPIGAATAALGVLAGLIYAHEKAIDAQDEKLHESNRTLSEHLATLQGLTEGTAEWEKTVRRLTSSLNVLVPQARESATATGLENAEGRLQIEKNKRLKETIDKLIPSMFEFSKNQKQAAAESDAFGAKVKSETETLEKNTKALADNAIATIGFIQSELSRTTLTGESRKALESSLAEWKKYSEHLGDIVHGIDKNHEKAAKGYNEHAGIEEGKDKTAYQRAEDQLRLALSNRLIVIQQSAKSEEELKQKSAQAELTFDKELLGSTRLIKDGSEREKVASEITLRIANKEGQIKRDALKEQDKDRKEAIKKEESEFQGQLQALVKFHAEQQKLEQKSLSDKDKIRREIEDRQTGLIKDKKKHDLAEEELRYTREKEKINKEIEGFSNKNALLELLEQEHADKLVEIGKEANKPLKETNQFLTEISKSFKDGATNAQNWGMTLGVVLAKIIDVLAKDGAMEHAKLPSLNAGFQKLLNPSMDVNMPKASGFGAPSLTDIMGLSIARPANLPGGVISGPGGPKDDKVLIRASNGEFMIPAEIVALYGPDFFQRLIRRYADGGLIGIPRFAGGGIIRDAVGEGGGEDLGVLMSALRPDANDGTVSAAKKKTIIEKISDTVSQSKLGHGVSSFLSGFIGVGPNEEAQKNLDALTGVQGGNLAKLGMATGIFHAGGAAVAHLAEHGAKAAFKSGKFFYDAVHAGHGGYELAADLSSEEIPKFAFGDFTGSGNSSDVAGFVHKNEFVFSADATKRIGVDKLRALHAFGRGYEDGGLASILSSLGGIGDKGGDLSSLEKLIGKSPMRGGGVGASMLNSGMSKMSSNMIALGKESGQAETQGIGAAIGIGQSLLSGDPSAGINSIVSLFNQPQQEHYTPHTSHMVSAKAGSDVPALLKNIHTALQERPAANILDQNLQRLSANQSLYMERLTGS